MITGLENAGVFCNFVCDLNEMIWNECRDWPLARERARRIEREEEREIQEAQDHFPERKGRRKKWSKNEEEKERKDMGLRNFRLLENIRSDDASTRTLFVRTFPFFDISATARHIADANPPPPPPPAEGRERGRRHWDLDT